MQRHRRQLLGYGRQGLPWIKEPKGLAVLGIGVAVIGMIAGVFLLVIGGGTAGTQMWAVFVAGLVLFILQGALRERALRRHVEAWHNWVLTQQSAYAHAAPMGAPAPAGQPAAAGPPAPEDAPAPSSTPTANPDPPSN